MQNSNKGATIVAEGLGHAAAGWLELAVFSTGQAQALPHRSHPAAPIHPHPDAKRCQARIPLTTGCKQHQDREAAVTKRKEVSVTAFFGKMPLDPPFLDKQEPHKISDIFHP